MTSKETRQAFLKFWQSKGHKVVPSSSLVPKDDPSVLLTPAGMQQFKPYFLGEESPYGNRVTSIQKSFRTSDIEAVGDETHLTFFEMLGNFSFSYPQGKDSYFKEEAIGWGLEFIQKSLGVDRKRITVSVFGGDTELPMDTESIAIWKKLGFSDNEIKKGNRADNFWGPTGSEGPCGPTAEIYVDGVEIWNLVFNEYHQERGKKLTKLPAQGVDTGAGLERLTQVLQGKRTVYETDLFNPIISTIKKALPLMNDLAISRQDQAQRDRPTRIIADHLRAAIFLIADGVGPSNKEQGYILRRLIRRSLVLARGQGTAQWFEPVIESVMKTFGDSYPELVKNRIHIFEIVKEEAKKFGKTLERGLREFEKVQSEDAITGEDAFRLYETYGFPIELTEELARGEGITVDRQGFEAAKEDHQTKSRAGAAGKFGGHGLLSSAGGIIGGSTEEQERILRLHTATHLLHQALRDVFGDTVKQMGSDINSERLRFDFSHPTQLTPEEISKVEAIVNEKIKAQLPVYRQEMTREAAEKTGALAFFRDRYGGTVSVYFIGSKDPVKAYSKEFCAGPHVTKTSEIGLFKILKEEAVGAGVRRIKATVE